MTDRFFTLFSQSTHWNTDMRKLAFVLAVIAATITTTMFIRTNPASADPLTIGIVGDQTGAANLDTAYEVLQQGVDTLKGESMDVVLHVGDLVESTQSEAEIRNRFAQATAILNQLPAKWYMTVGDHDVNPPAFVQNSPDRSRELLFQQLYSAINPLTANNLYYSFDVKNYHIVVLYSIEHLDTDPRWGDIFYSRISDAQYNWLTADLAANAAGKDGIIVLLHQPMWYNWSDWSRVHQVLAQYKANAVIAGHFHYNQTQLTLDGVNYRVMGATGGTTKQGTANAGDLQHVSLMKVDGTDIQYKLIPLAPYVQNQWTSRNTMDRIQALDTLMGNIYSFPTNSPVFLDNGKLVASCGSADPAKLVLKDIGNAIARNVSVTINVTGNHVKTDNGTFGANFCATDIDEYSCSLNASAGVAVSNNSVVEMSSYPPPAPLWTGTVLVDGSPPAIDTPITLQVLMSFNEDNQTYTVFKTGTTKVQGCS